MKKTRFAIAFFFLLTQIALLPSQGLLGQEKSKAESDIKESAADAAGRFMRIRKDARGRSLALETSVTRYETLDQDNNRITVDLIGAVHIGEKEYFETLNDRFESYESLLYELVAPEGTVIPKGGGPREGIAMNPVAALQKTMQVSLDLAFQLEHIDYTKKNFTHADMTPEEFAESMVENDESIGGYAIRAIGQSMAMQSVGKGGDNVGMLMAMFSSNKTMRLRRSFAKQMQQMETGLVMFEGRDGSTIINHRNDKCMEILKDEIKSGKRNLAIFYGAGHLVDMEKKLLEDFGMKRAGQYWLTAWKLRD
ncbi:MAG: hypothetical protein AAF939_11670 [Planctomycetota bacterium]